MGAKKDPTSVIYWNNYVSFFTASKQQPENNWFQICKAKHKNPETRSLPLKTDLYREASLSDEFNEKIFVELTKLFFGKISGSLKTKEEVEDFLNWHYNHIKNDKELFVKYIGFVYKSLPGNYTFKGEKENAFIYWIKEKNNAFVQNKSEHNPVKETSKEPEVKYKIKKKTPTIEHFRWAGQLYIRENLYEILATQEPKYIEAAGGKEEFKKALGDENSNYTGNPKIKWLKSQRLLACLMGALIDFECIHKNSNYAKIIEETGCIIDKHGKNFKAEALRNAKSQSETKVIKAAEELVQSALMVPTSK